MVDVCANPDTTVGEVAGCTHDHKAVAETVALLEQLA